MAFENDIAETIAPVLTLIGQQARLDSNWSCHMLEAVAGQLLPDYHRQRRDAAESGDERVRHGLKLASDETGPLDDLVQLADDLAAEDRLLDALYWISKALELRPEDGELYRFKASILERMGRFEEALVAAQQAEELGADAEAIVCDIDRLNAQHAATLEAMTEQVIPEFHRRRRDDSDSTLDRIRHGEQVATGPRAEVGDLVELAHACASEEQLSDALHWLDKAIGLQPEDGELRRFKASLLERMGRFGEALEVAIEAKCLGADPVCITSDIERINAQRIADWRAGAQSLDIATSLASYSQRLAAGDLAFRDLLKFSGKLIRTMIKPNAVANG